MENHASNATTAENPPFAWVEEPNERGTFGVLSFCFSTMIICVWNTLHFNIPTTRYRRTHRIFLRVFWMFIALLAPEVVLYIAINQRIDASSLAKQAKKYLRTARLAKSAGDSNSIPENPTSECVSTHDKDPKIQW